MTWNINNANKKNLKRLKNSLLRTYMVKATLYKKEWQATEAATAVGFKKVFLKISQNS